MARIGTVIREVYRRPGMDALPAHLEARYGIRVTRVAALDVGVVRVDHDAGQPWVARMFVSHRPVARVEGDAEVLRLLERHGFPAERAAHPEPVSVLDGRAVLVTRHVEGTRLPSTPAARRRFGAQLGALHQLPTEPGPTERPAGSLHHLPTHEGGPGQDLAAAAAMLDDLEGRVPPEHRRTHETLRALLPRGDACDGLPEAFVHPDPARSNVINTPSGPVLVDWAGAGRGPRLASLAVLLDSVGPTHTPTALAGYRTHVQLGADELDRVEGALWTRPLWLAAWQCWLAVVSAKVHDAHVPDGDRIAAIAAQVRAAS